VEEVLPAARDRGRHFVIFNYDGEHQITVTVVDETMCRHYYVTTTRGKAAISSSDDEDDE
jgi:hypothetical protein